MSLKENTILVLENTKVNENTFIQRGFVMSSFTTLKGNITPGLNVSVGSVYTRGNISRSFINLSNTGPYFGNQTLENTSEQNLDQVVNNYLTSLIPGQYPNVSGPYEENQLYYSLPLIQEEVSNNPEVYFCKILGFGIGEILKLRVSEVSRNSVSALTQNFIPASLYPKQTNWGNILNGYTSPTTLTGQTPYTVGFDWSKTFSVTVLNGQNTFPNMGWSGTRLSTITPVPLYFQQNSDFNFPSMLLGLSDAYNPIGIIYAGQGVQITNYPSNETETIEEILDRKNRTFESKINNRLQEISFISSQPYQQGRGSFEYVSREATYRIFGSFDILSLQTTFGPEGVQPGRNNAFMGVSLTDFWNETNKTNHNAPLVLDSEDDNPLPWTPDYAYKSQDNVPVLNDGISTLIISGAYPLYRKSNNSEWNGINSITTGIQGSGFDQYYITQSFWDPNIQESIENNDISIMPYPPYNIKGGRIILYEGQRVIAGSYVYSSINMTGNVNMSQFYPPSAKNIQLIQTEKNQLIGDLYARFQSNQGGVIVMVTVDGRPPPNPPPCAQPIGVVLEDVIGFGSPQTTQGQIDYGFQTEASLSQQIIFDYSTTNQIQSREILIKIFPMYANLNLFGFPKMLRSQQVPSLGLPYTVSTNFELGEGIVPMYAKVKTLYTLHCSPYGWTLSTSNNNNPFYGNSIKSKQFANDSPGPQSVVF
jgi:hypothetical protein